MGKSRALNIFLLKEKVEPSDAIKNISKFNRTKTSVPDVEEAWIFYRESKPREPNWVELLNGGTAKKINLTNRHSSAFLFAKVEKRWFALAFGYAHGSINAECIEHFFGRNSALKLVDPNKIKSGQAMSFGYRHVHISKQARGYVSMDDLNLEPEEDMLQCLGGKAQDQDLASYVQGKDSLQLRTDVSFIDLGRKLKQILSAFEERAENPFVNGFLHVTNAERIRLLDSRLNVNFAAEQFNRMYLDCPAKYYLDIPPKVFISHSKFEFSEFTLLEYFDQRNSEQSLTCDELRQATVQFIHDETRIGQAALYDCLSVELEESDNAFVLWEGKWYEVEKEFNANLKSYVDSIAISDFKLPSSKGLHTETDYIRQLSGTQNGFEVMDQKFISLSTNRRELEACDVLTKHGEFIHIKWGTTSSKISHLCYQAENSLRCFLNSRQFRSQARSYLKGQSLKGFFNRAKPDPSKIGVTLAIATRQKGSWSKVLPFFAQMSIRATAKEVRKYGVEFKLMRLEI